MEFGTFASAGRQTTEFPEFGDGDVRIIISGSRQYQLHSSVLRNASPVMRRLLDEKFAPTLNNKAHKRGVVIRFRLQLVQNPDLGDGNGETQYILEPVMVNEEGKAMNSKPIALDLENGKAVDPTHIAYHAVFGALYQVPVELGDFSADALTDILETAMSITNVAEYLQSTHVITKPIEATLLSTGQTIQESIANLPVAWLDYAYRIRSRVLFREALIHSTGRYFMDDVQNNLDQIDPVVAAVLKKKALMLKEGVKKAMLNLLSYYPTHIQREKTVGRADKDSIGRASYANDIFDWLALVVLRHYFTHQVADDQTHQAQDLGKSVFDAITAGGDAYLSKPNLEQWHEYFPMSNKGNNVVEYKLSELKETVKKFVAPFAKNEAQLDLRATPMKHFTCTKVELADYPWEMPLSAPRQKFGDYESDTEEDDDDVVMATA